MLTSQPWLDPTLIGEAKILVEVKLDRAFPQRVALEDESGSISMVNVIYSWLPSKCSSCGQLGHKASRCLGLQQPTTKLWSTLNSHVQKSKEVLHSDPSITKINDLSALAEEGSTLAAPITVKAPLETISMTSEIQQRDYATDIRNGVLSGYVSYDDSAYRSRGGRYIKPSQKIKEMEWTTTGKGRRGRGGYGGHGGHNYGRG
ncbi:unnamed protein product [Cochlearia groenlandica]